MMANTRPETKDRSG